VKKHLVIFLVLLFGIGAFYYGVHAQSATLFFSPSSGTYSVGKTFLVVVSVNSDGNPGINAADGTVNFDKSKLSVVSAKRDSSIFNLWTSEPTFSNANGTITFGGGNPSAYKGSSGNVFTITFRTISEGSASVSLSGASVLAADGKGTNVLASSNGASYTIVKVVAPPPPPPPPPPPVFSGPTPAAVVIESPSHPDEELWYKDKNPKFTWNLPTGVSAVRLLLDHASGSTPSVVYNRRISERQLEKVKDGTWYFHVQLRNGGGWGKVAHRKLLIDTSPPLEFEVTIESTDNKHALVLEAVDDISGVSYYKIVIDGGEPLRVNSEELEDGNRFILPTQDPGEHEVIVSVFDQVDNSRTAEVVSYTEVAPPPPLPPSEIEGDEQAPWYADLKLQSLIVIAILLIIIVVLLVIIIRQRKKYLREFGRVKKETTEARTKTDSVFSALREEVKEQMEKVQQATPEGDEIEKQVTESIEGALDLSEDIISKEIEDIDKSFGEE